jgi:hypothetical protein
MQTRRDCALVRKAQRQDRAVQDRLVQDGLMTDSATARRLQLGLLLPRHEGVLPPVSLLAARAGWQSLWLPLGAAWPQQAAAAGMRIGWVVEEAPRVLDQAADVWLRGAAAAEAIAVLQSGVPEAHEISVDVSDAAGVAAIHAAGAVAVFGPASVDVLIDLLRSSEGRSAVCLPASPGRTVAESHARLAADPGLGAEAEIAPGLVGTLEDCQQTVAALYAAGLRELRLRLPATQDIPDVIAQMSTLRAEVLSGIEAGSPRSPSPDAPATWGGRP